MTTLTPPPGILINWLTLGILRARWISRTNRALHHRTGFLFAYFLQPFANYGLAKRLSLALADVGSSHRESPFWCFWLSGWPFIGANRRLRRGVARLNDALSVRRQVPVLVG